MNKPYVFDDQGGIVFRSKRRAWEVRVPAWVYDLWMPLLGAEVIGVYALYVRLEMGDVVRKFRMRDIANACRVGDRRLNIINATLEECQFIEIVRPAGWRRAKHYTTEIVLLDAPNEISPATIEQYQHPQGYMPLTKWLIGSNDLDTPNGVSENVETSNGVSMDTSNGVSHYINTLDVNSLHPSPDADQNQPTQPPIQTRSAKRMGWMEDLNQSQKESLDYLRRCGVKAEHHLQQFCKLPLSIIEREWASVHNSRKARDKAACLITQLSALPADPEPPMPVSAGPKKPVDPKTLPSWATLSELEQREAEGDHYIAMTAWRHRQAYGGGE